jgi:hypothetical protein
MCRPTQTPGQLIVCPAGRYRKSDNVTCTLCPEGRFANVTGSTVCLACPAGTFSNNTGASYCLNCPVHFYSESSEGVTSCIECPRGSRTLSTGSTSITSCQVQNCSSFTKSFVDSQGGRHYFEVSRKTNARFFAANVNCSTMLHGAHLFQVDSPAVLTSAFANVTGSLAPQVHFGAYNLGRRNFSWIDQNLTFAFNAFFSSTSYPGTLGKSNCTYLDTTSKQLGLAPGCSTSREFWCQISEFYCSINSSCSAGQYLDTSGYRPTCFPCPSGSYSKNFSGCSLCDRGSYQDKSGQSVCPFCPPGRVSSTPGSSLCQNCTAGYYGGTGSGAQSRTSCFACPAGKFQPNNGSNFCFSCAAGTVSNGTSVSCQACPSGFAASSDQSACAPCDPGKYQPLNTSSYCSLCPTGYFSNSTQSTFCYVCVDGTTAGNGAVQSSDCACNEGYYGSLPSIPCRPCRLSAGLRCPFNSTIPWIERGFYRSGTDGDQVNVALTCQPTEACDSTNLNPTTTCSAPYQGFLCGQCSSGYYRSGSTCKKCPGDGIKWLTLTAAVIALLFILGRVTSKRTELPVDFRITLQAVQMIALFPNITNNWPEYVRVILQIYTVTVCFISLSLISKF